MRALGPVLGASLAVSAGLVAASAQGPPPGRGSVHAQLVTLLTPVRAAGRHVHGLPGIPTGGPLEPQNASLLLNLAGLTGSSDDLSSVTGSGASVPGVPSPSDLAPSHLVDTLASPSGSSNGNGNGPGSGATPTGPTTTVTTSPTTTTGTRAPHLTTRVTPVSSFRRATATLSGTGAGQPASGPAGVAIPAPSPWPNVQLIPPASLPAPAVIVPASVGGLGPGAIAGLVVAILLLGALAVLRLARRPG